MIMYSNLGQIQMLNQGQDTALRGHVRMGAIGAWHPQNFAIFWYDSL